MNGVENQTDPNSTNAREVSSHQSSTAMSQLGLKPQTTIKTQTTGNDMKSAFAFLRICGGISSINDED